MLSIVKFDNRLERADFDCGVMALNVFLQNQMTQYIKRHETIAYCAIDDETNKIIGYYTLSNTAILQADDPLILKKHNPHSPIGCILLGRLAVDKQYQGCGLGSDLLLHALNVIKIVSQMVGVAFVVVDAKDEQSKQFYTNFGFKPLSINPMRLCYPIKNLFLTQS